MHQPVHCITHPAAKAPPLHSADDGDCIKHLGVVLDARRRAVADNSHYRTPHALDADRARLMSIDLVIAQLYSLEGFSR